MTAERVLSHAYHRGIRKQGFSDHLFHASDSLKMLGLREELRALPLPDDLEVFVGCEGQMHSPTEMTVTQALADKLDYVIMATNHFHLSVVADPEDTSVEGWVQYGLTMIASAIGLGYVDVIAHPLTFDRTGQITTVEAFECLQDRDLIDILVMARDANVAMELNPAILAHFPEQMARFFSLCLDIGVKLSPGSDAHSLSSVGYAHCKKQASRLVEKLGIQESDLWHCFGRTQGHRGETPRTCW